MTINSYMIIVRGIYDDEYFLEAHTKANECFVFGTENLTSPIVDEGINFMANFMIVPDGSKPNYKEHEEFEEKRIKYKKYLQEHNVEYFEIFLPECDVPSVIESSFL